MKTIAFILFLLFSLSVYADQPVWPGNFTDLESSFATSAFLGNGSGLKEGGSLELGLSLQSLGDNNGLHIRGAYIWQYNQINNIHSATKASFLLSHRDFYEGFYLEPQLGLALVKPISFDDSSLITGLEMGMEWGTPLYKNRNLIIRSSAYIPLSQKDTVYIALGAGLSRSSRILHRVHPPRVKLEELSRNFSPDGDGHEDRYILNIQTRHPKSIASWEMTIVDPIGTPFYNTSGQGRPPKEFVWNGTSNNGERVSSVVTYTLNLKIEDLLGNIQNHELDIQTGILVLQDGDRWKIRIPSIVYAPNSSVLLTDDTETGNRNQDILIKLAEIFERFPEYTIQIEGHANHRMDPESREGVLEQEEILIPLSLERAEAVKLALMELGIEGDRVIASGIGGADPIFSFNDSQNSWKNRRVEFILLR